MIIFENAETLEGVECDTSYQLGPYYNYSELILHNYKIVPIQLEPNTHLGNLSVKALSDDGTFLLHFVEEKTFEEL